MIYDVNIFIYTITEPVLYIYIMVEKRYIIIVAPPVCLASVLCHVCAVLCAVCAVRCHVYAVNENDGINNVVIATITEAVSPYSDFLKGSR